MTPESIVQVGKYANKPMKELLNDKNYCDFLLGMEVRKPYFESIVQTFLIPEASPVRVENDEDYYCSVMIDPNDAVMIEDDWDDDDTSDGYCDSDDESPTLPPKGEEELCAKTYHKKFLEALKQASIVPHEIYYKDQWKYAGGEMGRHCLKLKSALGKGFWHFVDTIKRKDRCICTHWIVENCYIQSILTGRILIVGNCCIKKFLKIDTTKRCQNCAEPHSNRLDNFCFDCRGNKFKQGQYKGQSFRWVMSNDPNYTNWICTKLKRPQGDFADFVEFVKQNKLT